MVKRQCPRVPLLLLLASGCRGAALPGLRRARPTIHGRLTPQGEAEELPAGDGAHALPCLPVIGDAREPAAQFNRGRELAALLEDGPDRRPSRLWWVDHRGLPVPSKPRELPVPPASAVRPGP